MKGKTRMARRKKTPGAKAVGRALGESDAATLEPEIAAAVDEEVSEERVEQDVPVECPYCGESFEIRVNSEDDGQVLYEDCQVCCRSLVLNVHKEDDEFEAEASRA